MMEDGLSIPLVIRDENGYMSLMRRPVDRDSALDGLIELIIFTPRGSFNGDPDFGFEYWNYEYANVNCREFNNGQRMPHTEVTRQECEESVRQSLETYAPWLKQVVVSMELSALSSMQRSRRKSYSRYEVSVSVSGSIDDGLGVQRTYGKEVRFLMEPLAKTMII